MRKIDQDVLVGFIEEAKGYLPQILQGLDAYRRDSANVDALDEVHRLVHTVKGAAAMVGFAGLSHMAYQLEEAVEEVRGGQLAFNDEIHALFRWTVSHLETYLDGARVGTLSEKPLVMNVLKAFRKLKGQPDEPETESLDEVLEGLSDAEAQTPALTPEPDWAAPVEEPAPIASVPVVVSAASSDSDDEAEEDVSPELMEVFLLEAEEHLRTMSSLLPTLEREPENREPLQEIRRSAHTLKGSAAMVGFRRLTKLAHRMEDLLDLLFEGKVAFTPEMLKLLFASTDALEDLANRRGDASAISSLYAQYDALLASVGAEAPAETSEAVPEVETDEAAPVEAAPGEAKKVAAAVAARGAGAYVRIPIEQLDDLVKLVSELVITRSVFEARMADFGKVLNDLSPSTERLRRASNKIESQYEASALAGDRSRGAVSGPAAGPALMTFRTYGFDDLEFDRYTEFHLLSRELVETTNDVQTVSAELGNILGDFDSYLNRQARLSSEVEDKLMRLRMVPLATIASKLHRTVRNVASTLGKEVELVLEGESTELDKTVLEEMADPLLHLLRNAVDHGVEPSELRVAQGKTPRATIRLRAYHEGSHVYLQIADDGAGVDAQAIRATAVQRGLLSGADAEQMGDEELCDLVFLPGFSTAASVSEISGRGVGLDVVRARVHKLKGTVRLDSKPGKGTTFTVRLPLTLAITRALLVRANRETFALPLDSIEQILRLEDDATGSVGTEKVLRLKDQTVPVVHLGKALGLRQAADAAPRPPAIVINLGSRKIALVVDQLLGGKEIVIKNLGPHLRRVPGVSGATLMGDGSVVLILNPAELALARESASPARTPGRSTGGGGRAGHVINVMVVDDSPSVRRVVSNLIKSAGWNAIPAKDGLDALENLHVAPVKPDVVMLDIEMPRMDGYELLTTLKAEAALRDIPVVMVTSRAGEKHRKKAMDLGASAYLVKPYQDETLLGVIRSLAAQSAAQGASAHGKQAAHA